MTKLAQKITLILESCDLRQLKDALNDLSFRKFLDGQSLLYVLDRIGYLCSSLEQIALGEKLSLNRMNTLIDQLEGRINEFNGPKFGYRNAVIEYDGRAVMDFLSINDGQDKSSLVIQLREAVKECMASFQVYTLYPFAREHKKPARGVSLLNSEAYGHLHTLLGDDLKTGILEVMFEKLAVATKDNFGQIRDEILGSEAYRILSTSQSMMSIYKLFHEGKTTSQSIIDNHLEEKEREFLPVEASVTPA